MSATSVPTSMRSPGRVFWPLAAALVLADCATQRAVEKSAPLVGVPRPILDGSTLSTLGSAQRGFCVFNVADAGVTVGAILVAYALWRSDVVRSAPAERVQERRN